jgi:hypothetical protein
VDTVADKLLKIHIVAMKVYFCSSATPALPATFRSRFSNVTRLCRIP